MRSIRRIIPAFKVNMGGIILDQALPDNETEQHDPFLLLHHWKGTIQKGSLQKDLGVGPHPHRGFSPVTFIVEGEIMHQDSRGNKVINGTGGIQWMNAGMGIIHSERPSFRLARQGGTFEIVQIWINTPAVHKMDQPEYFAREFQSLPFTELGTDSSLHLVSGTYNDLKGPVAAKSPMLCGWLHGATGTSVKLNINQNWNTAIYVVDGGVQISGEKAFAKDLVLFENDSDNVELTFTSVTKLILLAGEPINEKKVAQGPFVMNSETEILQAIRDYQMGKMGFLVEDLS